MKKYIIFTVLFALFSTTFSFANNKGESIKNKTNSIEVSQDIQNDVEKWNIKADTWIIKENRWYEYQQLITICWTRNTGYYMWSIGGIKTPVNTSDKRGYDYMVDSPNGKWRFYFRRVDLR